MTPKLSQNETSELKVNIENKICWTTWVDPKTVVKLYSNPKNSSLGPKKVKKDTKIKSISKVRIDRNTENESCSTIWVNTKTVVEPYPNPKNSPLGLQKVKNDPKIKQKPNQIKSIKSNSNIKIDWIMQNESSSTTWLDLIRNSFQTPPQPQK